MVKRYVRMCRDAAVLADDRSADAILAPILRDIAGLDGARWARVRSDTATAIQAEELVEKVVALKCPVQKNLIVSLTKRISE